MAIVYCDLVSGIDWYALSAWSSVTTYAVGNRVKTGSVSADAKVYESLQNNNTNHAVSDGAWWSLIADGSAGKPFKSIDDSTRGAAADDVRVAASPAHTAVANPSNYTFYSSGTYEGRCVVSGDVSGTWSVDDYIGDDIAFWRVRSVTYAAPNTIIDIGPISNGGQWVNPTLTDWTPIDLYKASGITPAATQALINNGLSKEQQKTITCGWDLSTETRSTLGRTYLFGNGFGFANKQFVSIDGLCQLYSPYGFNSFFGVIQNVMMSSTTGSSFTIGGSYGYFAKAKNVTLVGCSAIVQNNNQLEDCIILGGTINTSVSYSVIRNTKIVCKTQYPIFNLNNNDNIYLDNVSVNGGSSASGWFAFNSNMFLNGQRLVWAKNLITDFGKMGNTLNGMCTISEDHQGVAGDCRQYLIGGSILSDTTTVHTVGGISWRHEPGANATPAYPLEFRTKQNIDGGVSSNDPFAVAATAGKTATITIYIKKSSVDTALEARLICRGGQLGGVPNDVVAVAIDDTDWKPLTIQVTPSETGVMRFAVQVWGSSTETVHVADFEASEA